MNYLDILILLPLLYAVWSGYQKGIIVQLGGIAGILIGVWLAYRFSTDVGIFLHIPSTIARPAGFLVIVLVCLLLMAILSRIIGKLFDAVGLGAFNIVGGIMLSILKISLIVSVLLVGLNAVNHTTGWVDSATLDGSKLYHPVRKFSGIVFPYLKSIKNEIID